MLHLQYSYEYGNWNLFKTKSKWASKEMCLGYFLEFLELPQLRTHIGSCFQSVCEAAVTRIFSKYRGKKTWWNPFTVKLYENPKNSNFPECPLRVSLPFGIRVTFIFLQEYRKVWIIMGEKLWRIEITYFFSSCLWDLNYNYLLYGKKVRDSNLFIMI